MKSPLADLERLTGKLVSAEKPEQQEGAGNHSESPNGLAGTLQSVTSWPANLIVSPSALPTAKLCDI